MITCPWCGTNYTSFQPNCDNCGGSLPLPPETAAVPSTRSLPAPPPPPRNVPRQAVWHILFSDGHVVGVPDLGHQAATQPDDDLWKWADSR